MFDFRDLIEHYSSDIAIIRQNEGHYDYSQGGVWVPGDEERIETRGAVISLSTNELNEQLQHGEGGAYTRDDRKIYTHKDINPGETVEHNGLRYTVAEKVPYSDLASGLNIYYVRRVM